MRELTGKTAFVTGGASGIGWAMGRAFAEAGMKAMLADIETEALAAAVKSLHNFGLAVRSVICDVADPASVERAAKASFDAFGNVNLVGVVHGVRSFLPHIRSHGEGGHIVNTASMAGMINGMGFSPYAATKFAVVSMSEGLAAQLKPFGIGVSVLCPSYVRTGIGESGRNRPQRYGPTQPLDPASPAAAMVAEIATRLQAGLDPAAVAARVLGAISNDELYVFTHPNMRTGVDERFAAIRAAMDKVAD